MTTPRRRWLWRALCAGLLGLVAAGIVVTYKPLLRRALSVDTGTASVTQPPGGACLPGDPVALLASPHIPYTTAPHPTYDSVPPTSGAHVPFTVAPGVYQEQIPEAVQVHALEHGHVLIQYAPGTAGHDLAALTTIARADPRNVVLAPYSRLRHGIALTAWGRIERLRHADGARISAFVEALSGRYNHGWRHADRCAS